MADEQLGDYIPEEGPIALSFAKNLANEQSFAQQFRANINYHKSLDFSNVGHYAEGEKETGKSLNEKAIAFRQFHQTRIYVSGFDGMNRHTVPGENQTYVISANLPELVNYRIGSEWNAPLQGMGSSLGSALLGLAKSGLLQADNSLVKNIGSYMPDSMFNRAQTIQLWNGSKPLTMSITIPVIDDGSYGKITQIGRNTNFSEALEFLGSLCLPRYIKEGEGGETDSGVQRWGFYKPPPSPLKISLKGYGYIEKEGEVLGIKETNYTRKNYAKQQTEVIGGYSSAITAKKSDVGKLNTNKKVEGNFTQTYGRIMIQLGGMLLIDNCIITGIDVRYTNTKSLIRHHYDAEQNHNTELDYLTPIIAELTINFSTVEAITSNIYSKMLWGVRQPDMGTGSVNLGSAQQLVEKIRDYLQPKTQTGK